MTAIQGMMYSVLFISSDTESLTIGRDDKIKISSGNSGMFALSIKHTSLSRRCLFVYLFFNRIILDATFLSRIKTVVLICK